MKLYHNKRINNLRSGEYLSNGIFASTLKDLVIKKACTFFYKSFQNMQLVIISNHIIWFNDEKCNKKASLDVLP